MRIRCWLAWMRAKLHSFVGTRKRLADLLLCLFLHCGDWLDRQICTIFDKDKYIAKGIFIGRSA